MDDFSRKPIIIGGTGGSGTRILQSICSACDLYTGSELNNAGDSLSFKEFFDKWINPYLSSGLDADAATAMRTELFACVDNHRCNIPGEKSPWVWKNPRTILLLPFLHDCFPMMKFVHVVRDGRDMAISQNQNQVRKHGEAVVAESFEAGQEQARAIRFWEKTNLAAAAYGQQVLQESYLLVRYEDLVLEPYDQVQKIVGFLGSSKNVSFEIDISRVDKWKNLPVQESAALTEIAKEGLLYFNYL